MRYAPTYGRIANAAYAAYARIVPPGMCDGKKHCTGKPDGAAKGGDISECCDKDFCDAWKRRPLSRAGAPK